ncbi:hypothetical protein D9758_015996 [Tetrapyrgos nigripes]|uniref:Uncharacterized protein n=1 Tax=Tetrapyrgos nigripes TaxID=182062 RepID=A0A8H5FAS1_9AGAR|nr:hypothetical protein D9758_015996 [Tetrapyrgos nigripes]
MAPAMSSVTREDAPREESLAVTAKGTMRPMRLGSSLQQIPSALKFLAHFAVSGVVSESGMPRCCLWLLGRRMESFSQSEREDYAYDRMPRSKAKPSIALSLNTNLFVDIMVVIGVNLRSLVHRGKADCGDIDILITRDTVDGRTHQGILKRPLQKKNSTKSTS